ncbi:hypothetical protein Asulf_00910 [Archaeoglobus sulfaticallidus PM70-1]|uniref:UPF0182 protein Asulf_00910 n=1 Tax=Archaeoglobus sulfaticallidus PM70-1 TaxID=387631 RepID=N0BK89_9EURY|nr:UPF0182 family protein [Archaeoglobus sulfaticallidus]AGK60916.1 hypothetical protein Asulf_00910 [Archaeoglobus sulfaticallidus PM70-1]
MVKKFEITTTGRKIVLAIFVALLVFPSIVLYFYTEFLWFESLNLSSVFMAMLYYKVILFVIFFAFAFAMLSLNHFALRRVSHELDEPLKLPFWVNILLALIVALLFSRVWLQYVYFTNSVDFNLKDPIFGLDVSFYVFKLPFIQTILFFFLTVLILAILISAAYYAFIFRDVKSFDELRDNFPQAGYAHASLILAGIFIFTAAYFYFARFDLLTSPHGAVMGAGYTDVQVRLPAMGLVALLSLLLAAVSIYLGHKRNIDAMPILLIVLAAVMLLSIVVAPAVVQKLKVEPNEIVVEEEYIRYGIDFTRFAYGLDVKKMYYSAENNLSVDTIERNRGTIDNIRIWDHRPLLSVYRQMQQIRTYYSINDVDVDRYYIDGRYTQLMITARELSTDLLSPRAQTWLNKHLIYTHGYGVVASPVNSVTKVGLPDLIIEDIPPKGKIAIERPEIYYGEITTNYVIVKTKQKEFDYPLGEGNVLTTYNGSGGVKLDSYFKKLIYAIKFADIKFLLSDYITTESRLMFHRDIIDRVSTLAPFLVYDRDPYITVIDGKQYWIIDSYTTLDKFPYSARYPTFNYVRNPVKVFVDTYNGIPKFYVIQEEPVIKVLMKAFPDLFTSADKMSEEERAHIRYPIDLFEVQAHIYATFHMDDAKTFYNREDVWEIPEEILEEDRIQMEPYYVILTLPGNDKPEFLLMLPFTPKGRDNIIAWLAARCDESYGELRLYEFPKGQLIYGPMQIEARIDQNADISKLFTLWGQVGSKVIRGNMLVIPIENSILYIEPIYLRAVNAQIPELRGVIVVYSDVLAMRPTLDEALIAVFGEEAPEIVEEESVQDLVKQLVELYSRAREEAGAGNWTGFGEYIERLGDTISRLNQTAGR